jgi:hypothetical protein
VRREAIRQCETVEPRALVEDRRARRPRTDRVRRDLRSNELDRQRPHEADDPGFSEVAANNPLFARPGEEIVEIVAGYGAVAAHCVAGGFDGIEIQCSHSVDRSLLPLACDQPPHRQLRGSLASRFRILREIVEYVRDAIGPERAVGVR